MKRLLTLITLTLILLSASAQGLITKRLGTEWEFRQQNVGTWLKAEVPGTVHTDLLANKKIGDPFYRDNEKSLQWVDKVNWEYRTVFDAEDICSRENADIVFHGLDTYAHIYLNGHKLLSTDNMFRTWRINIRHLLKPTANELYVQFYSPIVRGLELMTQYPGNTQMQANNDQSENGGLGDNKVSMFTRKAGYHYGWDWGPRFVTSGIWRPVEIQAWDNARLCDIYVYTKHADKSLAQIGADVSFAVSSPGSYTLEIAINGKTMLREPLILSTGNCKTEKIISVKSPKLWYPAGMGEQYLYDVTVKIIKEGKPIDSRLIKTGIRTALLIRERDSDGKGESFVMEINGQRVFCKGSNVIPSDVFLPRVTERKYEHLVASAADANMNMLRVWGGGVYEDDYFYSLCDHYGIMVWQDFMFACSMYPATPALMESIEAEVKDNVIRLRNHPSVVLWCGNNEIELAWDPWGRRDNWRLRRFCNKEQQQEFDKTYNEIFHTILPGAVRSLTHENIYWPSSPSPGDEIPSQRLNRSGDMHYWGVWHGKEPFENFEQNIPRFMSEYGFQSFPETSTVYTYTNAADRNIESEVMSAHQRSGIGNLRIRQYMEQYYKVPVRFEHILYLSQVLQAEGIKTGIEAHRRNMPYCMGSLYWQINDCWPVASWSGMDSFGRWKALHYFAKKAFAPLIISAHPNGKMLDIYTISDHTSNISGNLSLSLIDFKGNVLSNHSEPVTAKACAGNIIKSINVAQFLAGHNPSQVVLVYKFSGKDADYEALHYFDTIKNIELPKPEITTTVAKQGDNAVISVSTNVLAKNFTLFYNGIAGEFSDNYVDLLAGRTYRFFLRSDDSVEKITNKLTHITLYDTY